MRPAHPRGRCPRQALRNYVNDHPEIGYYWVYESSNIEVRASNGSTTKIDLGPGGTPIWAPSGNRIGATTSTQVTAYRLNPSAATSFTGPVSHATPTDWTSSAQADLHLTLTSLNTIHQGQNADFDFAITNNGRCAADDVALQGIGVGGLFPVSNSISTGTLSANGWGIGRLEPGATVHLQRLSSVYPGPGTNLHLHATVYSSTGDFQPADNSVNWDRTVS